MNNKLIKYLFLVALLLSANICFSQNKGKDKKYFATDITNKIKDPTYDLNLYWPDFIVTVENYNVWNEINYSNYDEILEPFVDWSDDKGIVIIDSTTFYYAMLSDTVFIDEEVFTDNIEGTIVRITPTKKNKNIHFKLSVAVNDVLTQYLPLEEYYVRDVSEESKLEVLEKVSPYKAIIDSGQYIFHIPDRDSISNIEQLKVDLALGDTCLYYEAESEGRDIKYIYKGMPTEHRVNGLIIRIEKYNKEVLIETKYIRISFPEAC